MSTKLGSLSIVCVQLGTSNCPLYGVAGCPLFRGCSIEVNGRTVGTFGIVRFIVGDRC